MNWLRDAEYLYAFGLLSRKGVLEAVGRYDGAWLMHLLRTSAGPGGES
jgi:hypothetical protein